MKSPRNQTLTLSEQEITGIRQKLYYVNEPTAIGEITNKTINQDFLEIIDFLPKNSVDLLFLDPPYNLTKSFGNLDFKQTSITKYSEYIENWLIKLLPLLKPTASIYFCGDWRSSTSIFMVCSKYFKIHNRITWEREKGRGAKSNWKNASEDIWFCTVSDKFTFNVDAVKLKRKVLAPYKVDGKPKDWEDGFRLTYPSNIWTDLTVPYWSMSENTEHPTQKPEKLLAKVLLASSNPDDMIFDPFLGSGTTSVVAKKLGRNFFGTEINFRYCCLAEKRLESENKEIQGIKDGIFYERNSKI